MMICCFRGIGCSGRHHVPAERRCIDDPRCIPSYRWRIPGFLVVHPAFPLFCSSNKGSRIIEFIETSVEGLSRLSLPEKGCEAVECSSAELELVIVLLWLCDCLSPAQVVVPILVFKNANLNKLISIFFKVLIYFDLLSSFCYCFVYLCNTVKLIFERNVTTTCKIRHCSLLFGCVRCERSQ